MDNTKEFTKVEESLKDKMIKCMLMVRNKEFNKS